MGISLQIDNRYVTIKGAKRSTIRKLEKVASYRVQGYMFSPAYPRYWDGREHLLTYSDKRGYRTPIGLLDDIIAALDDMSLSYDLDISPRRSIGARIVSTWNPSIKLRPYQKRAVSAMTKTKKHRRGRGILKMPIRSGKSYTAARIIHVFGRRTLFMVTSQMLLHQTRAALNKALGIEIGVIGDGEWIERDVTVATIQTLAIQRGGFRECNGDGKCGKPKCKKAKKPEPHKYKIPSTDRYKAIINAYDVIIFDECHHLRGDAWHKAVMDFDAPYRIGLSATVYLDNERENERGVIWLKACTGNIRYEVSTSYLIEQGYLMRQNVELYPIREPDLTDRRWSQSLRDEAIYKNAYRNALAALLIREKAKAGLRNLVISNRLNQISDLYDLIDGLGLVTEALTGKDGSQTRKDRVEAFSKGHIQVLIGTVFGEGVDIPEVECVVNAEGGRDMKATVQRMRNLTIAKGKTEAVIIDFMDLTNGYFAEHSKERLEVYRSEEAFNIRFIEPTPELIAEARRLASHCAA